jgi:transposase
MAEDRNNSASGKSAASARAKRTYRSKLERRKIAEEALAPGVSIAGVARAHGVRPNQVRHWRGLYCQGLLDEAASSALIPVTITEAGCQESGRLAMTPSVAESRSLQAPVAGTIRIETAKGRICVEGAAEASCLRVVLEYLLG